MAGRFCTSQINTHTGNIYLKSLICFSVEETATQHVPLFHRDIHPLPDGPIRSSCIDHLGQAPRRSHIPGVACDCHPLNPPLFRSSARPSTRAALPTHRGFRCTVRKCYTVCKTNVGVLPFSSSRCTLWVECAMLPWRYHFIIQLI